MKYQIAFVVFGLACCVLASPIAKVEPKIWEDFEKSETITVIVSFKKADTKAAYNRFHSLKLTSREAILDVHHAILKDHADIVQADVASILSKAAISGKRHELTQLWITNQLIVSNVDKEVVELLMNHPDVESLTAEFFIPLETMVEEGFFESGNNTIQNEWGIEAVSANLVWGTGNQGQGAVVGVIDTGARYTHETLYSNYQGTRQQYHDYAWFDPSAASVGFPTDSNGHGTHCTGTAVGSHGIGVAPQATWISCRGCATGACSNAHLLACGQFITCPTNTAGGAPQCGRAPNVVNNSWGGGTNSAWYDGVINGWRAVGILPVFAAGNSGGAGGTCSTTNSPGDRPGAFSVASVTVARQTSGFSSVGPATGNLGEQNPNVAAPGTSVLSASHLSDTGRSTLSGTSMAAPHVAGAAALYISANPLASLAQLQNSLQGGGELHVPLARTCAGTPETARPNNHSGYGIINIYRSVTGAF